jgi:hypothetical protein
MIEDRMCMIPMRDLRSLAEYTSRLIDVASLSADERNRATALHLKYRLHEAEFEYPSRDQIMELEHRLASTERQLGATVHDFEERKDADAATIETLKESAKQGLAYALENGIILSGENGKRQTIVSLTTINHKGERREIAAADLAEAFKKGWGWLAPPRK